MFYIDSFYRIKTRGFYIILVNQHTLKFLYKKIYYFYIYFIFIIIFYKLCLILNLF